MSIFRKDPSKDADAASDANQVAQAAATAVTAALQRPSVNQSLIDAERAKQRRPKDDTRAFKVHARGLKRKRRAGIEFTGDPQIVNAEDLTEDQAIELLNTPNLYVEELGSASKDAVKPNAAPAGPSPDQLRAPGDAPIPTSDNSPGRTGNASRVIGGMMAVEEAPAPQRPPTHQAHETPPKAKDK